MTIKEFQKLRSSVYIPKVVGNDDDLKNCQFVNVPVITSNGVMVNVQKRIEFEELDIPYIVYSNEFMQRNGVKQLKDIPASSFSVFDAINEVINGSKES